MPRWLRWMLRSGPAPEDSPERVHERRNAQTPVDTPLMAMDRAIMGPFSEALADKRARR